MSIKSITEYFELNGEFFVTGSNSPILLEGSGNLWYVKTGSVDVFSVQKEGNDVKGARIYLFSVNAGSILFGLDYSDTPGRCFLAVGNTDVQVCRINLTQLLCYFTDHNLLPSFAQLLDTWILSLTAGVARDISLRYDTALDKPGEYSIPENKKIRARKGVLWLHVQQGCITLLDNDISEFAGRKYFPITENSWCMTINPVKTTALNTTEIVKDNLFTEYLAFYHDQVLALENFNIRMLKVDYFVRNKEKIEILKKADKAAWQNIAEILNESPEPSAGFKTNDSLLEACRILGAYLGIKITEPQPDKKRTPGLNEIAHESKFGYRKIALSTDWWKTNSGPFLAFTKKNEPVVLIPLASGTYKVKYPFKKKDIKLTPALAEEIGNTGYTFYKPFPFKQITPFEFLKFIYKSCKQEFTLLITAGIIGGLLTLFLPLVTGIIIDTVIPQSDRLKLYGLGLAIVFSVFALVIAQIIRSLSYIRLDTKIEYLVQSALWDRLINLPVSFFNKFSSGELAAKANSIGRLKQILSFSVINTIIYNSFMVFNLFVLFYYDVVLALLSSSLFVIYSLFIIAAGLKIKKMNYHVIQNENRITSFINQALNSIAKIKIAGAEKLAFKLWTDKYSIKQKGEYQN
jgi:hypothetical protein